MGDGTKITNEWSGRPWLPVDPGAAGISSRSVAAEAGLWRGTMCRHGSTKDNLASEPFATNLPRNRMDTATARAEANDRGREVQRAGPLRLRAVRQGLGARHLCDVRAPRRSQEMHAESWELVHGAPRVIADARRPRVDPAPRSRACRLSPRPRRSSGNRDRVSRAYQARLVSAVGHGRRAVGAFVEGANFFWAF